MGQAGTSVDEKCKYEVILGLLACDDVTECRCKVIAYTVSQKGETTYYCPYLHQILSD